jgi:DNA repair protein RadC
MKSDVPHYHGHRQRLRERFLKSGFAGMAEHEVVELLLTLAIPRKDVKKPAKDLLARCRIHCLLKNWAQDVPRSGIVFWLPYSRT